MPGNKREIVIVAVGGMRLEDLNPSQAKELIYVLADIGLDAYLRDSNQEQDAGTPIYVTQERFTDFAAEHGLSKRAVRSMWHQLFLDNRQLFYRDQLPEAAAEQKEIMTQLREKGVDIYESDEHPAASFAYKSPKFGWLELFKAVDPERVKDLWTPTPKVVSDVIAECFELNIATARVLLSELPPSLREKPSFACLNDFLQQPELQP